MTELGGVALHLGRIEIVLADEQAESIAKQRLAITREIPVVFRVLLKSRHDGVLDFDRSGETAYFFDRAEANAVGLAECAVDGSGLGDSHLGAADKRGDIGRVGVTIAGESFAAL